VVKKKVQNEFNTCSPINSSLDIATFLEYMADTISGFVQYNNDNNKYYPFNVEKMCNILQSGPLDEAFPDFYAQWNKFSGESCSESSYQSYMADLMNVDPKNPAASGRSWYYQTCNEFGYYQTGESVLSPFSPAITLDYFLQMCQIAFGISKDMVEQNVYNTNQYYGGRNLNSSRIMFTNGVVDPWHKLGITTTIGPELPAILMEGTAHCADLYPSRLNDLPVLSQTRSTFISYLQVWLNE